MEIPKKYFHDKPVLALLSANLFLAILVTLMVLLRLSGNSGGDFIVQYRENLGLNAFAAGTVLDMLSFILFAVAILVVSTVLSLRVYELKRQLSLVVLGFGILLLVLTLIVSNALLVLQ
jgi:hypothetical protein